MGRAAGTGLSCAATFLRRLNVFTWFFQLRPAALPNQAVARAEEGAEAPSSNVALLFVFGRLTFGSSQTDQFVRAQSWLLYRLD
jgi:hypothetical protein